jgi:hypothetical protein
VKGMDEDEDELMVDYDYSDLSMQDSITELFALIHHKKFNADEKMQLQALKDHILSLANSIQYTKDKRHAS